MEEEEAEDEEGNDTEQQADVSTRNKLSCLEQWQAAVRASTNVSQVQLDDRFLLPRNRRMLPHQTLSYDHASNAYNPLELQSVH